MARDLKHFVEEQNRSALRYHFNIDAIANKYANRGDAEFESVLDISSGKVLTDKTKKFDALRPFGSAKLAYTKRHDCYVGDQQHPEYANQIELNSSGNTNISVQSRQTQRDKFHDDDYEDDDLSVPEGVRDCVASFLEEPTEQEPSDAETLSSHSSDSDSDEEIENKAGNWYTEEEFTASSQENTDSGDDNEDDNDNENSADSSMHGRLDRQNSSARKQHVRYTPGKLCFQGCYKSYKPERVIVTKRPGPLVERITKNHDLDGTYTILPEAREEAETNKNRNYRSVHLRKPFKSHGDVDTVDQHGGSPTISERPHLDKSDSRYNDTQHFHDRLSSVDKIRNTDWLQIKVHKTANYGERVAVRNYSDSQTTSKFCNNTDPTGMVPATVSERTMQSRSRKVSQDDVCEAHTDGKEMSEDNSPRRLYHGQSERECRCQRSAEKTSCKQNLPVNDDSAERILAQKLQLRSQNEPVNQNSGKKLFGQYHSKNDKSSERCSVRKLYHRQSENENRTQNHKEESFTRQNKTRKDSSFERIYANVAQNSIPENQQRHEPLSPKASVQTQTPKSYTRDLSRERKYARESETQFKRLERPFGYEHGRHLSPTKHKSGQRTEHIGRAKHRDVEIQSPSRLIYDTSKSGYNLRDSKLFSSNISEEVRSRDNRREAQFSSSQRHQGNIRRENHNSSALSSPVYMKTAQTEFREDSIYLNSTKHKDSYDISDRRTTHYQYQIDADRSRAEFSGSRSSKFMSPKQQVNSKHVNHTDQELTPKQKLFNGNSEKNRNRRQSPEHMSRKGQDFSLVSPRRLDNPRHSEMESERYTKERELQNTDSHQYCKTSVSKRVKDYDEQEHNDRHMVSSLQDRIRQCSSKTNFKIRSLEYPNKPCKLEQQRDSESKSPERCEEKMRNSRLISPIQERFKTKQTRSEMLTAENLDMLNQSFNDSCINISQNQSALNASMAEENKEKISHWLDRLESSEEMLNDVCFPEANFQSHEASFEPRVQARSKHDKHPNTSHLQSRSNIPKSEHEFQKSDIVEKFRSPNEDLSDLRITKPPSKRFKVANKDDVFDIHKPSTGFIAKANAQSVHHRFKGMTNKELKAFLTSDDSGVSALVSVKPKQASLNDIQQNKLDKHSSKAVVSENTHASSYEHLGFNNKQQEQAVPEECKHLCSCNRVSREVGRNLSPKVQTRDRTPRKSPYSALSRTGTSASSGKSLAHDCHETKTSKEISNTYSLKQLENQDIRQRYDRYNTSSHEYDNKYVQRKAKSHNYVNQSEEHLTTPSSYEEGVVGHTSLSEGTVHEKQERNNVKHSDNFTDTASLNEYCEEGGQESCSCDDIEGKHEDLYESFESVDGPNVRSPKVEFKLRSPYASTPSNKRTPDLQSSCRTRSKDCQNDNQESPSVSMAKLKLNTPQSRRHLVNSPLADSGANRNSYLESQKRHSGDDLKSLPNQLNSDISDKIFTHAQQKCGDLDPMRNNQIRIRNSGADVIKSHSNTKKVTTEQGDGEKENYKQASIRSNNLKTKSKKSLFTVVGKTSSATEIAVVRATKPNSNFATDDCFKLPVSPVVQKRQSSAASKRNLSSANEKRIGPREIEYQTKPNMNRFGERVDTCKLSDRPKDSEQRSMKPVSQNYFSARSAKPYLQRPGNRFINQFEYAQSTPVHPGVRLSLNETFSTILSSEETEMEHDDEVMLIDD